MSLFVCVCSVSVVVTLPPALLGQCLLKLNRVFLHLAFVRLPCGGCEANLLNILNELDSDMLL